MYLQYHSKNSYLMRSHHIAYCQRESSTSNPGCINIFWCTWYLPQYIWSDLFTNVKSGIEDILRCWLSWNFENVMTFVKSFLNFLVYLPCNSWYKWLLFFVAKFQIAELLQSCRKNLMINYLSWGTCDTCLVLPVMSPILFCDCWVVCSSFMSRDAEFKTCWSFQTTKPTWFKLFIYLYMSWRETSYFF